LLHGDRDPSPRRTARERARRSWLTLPPCDQPIPEQQVAPEACRVASGGRRRRKASSSRPKRGNLRAVKRACAAAAANQGSRLDTDVRCINSKRIKKTVPEMGQGVGENPSLTEIPVRSSAPDVFCPIFPPVESPHPHISLVPWPFEVIQSAFAIIQGLH